MATYAEKLRDPRWQKKRLEILQRDNFKCQSPYCTSDRPRTVYTKPGHDTLHIHHFYYEKNANPWDYPSEHLITLCASCHEEVAEIQTKLTIRMAEMGLEFLFDMHNSHFTDIMQEFFQKRNMEIPKSINKSTNEGTTVF